jgi:hypothetical protein
MTETSFQSPEQLPRHSKLVSGSISRRSQAVIGVRWMLKRVQHDGGGVKSVAYRGQTQIDRQIDPLRVFRFDQIDLPTAMPVFDLLFPGYRAGHITEHFKTHQSVNRIFRRVSRHLVLAMLVKALDQVRGYADVKSTVGLACEYLDAWLFLLSHGLCMDARWTLKQVQGDELGAFGRE